MTAVPLFALLARTTTPAGIQTGAGGPPAAHVHPAPAPAAFPLQWLMPSVAVPVLTLLIGLIRFREVPPTLITHWTADGAGDRRVVPSMDSLFGLCTLQCVAAMAALMIIGCGWREGQRHAATTPHGVAAWRPHVRRVTCGLLAVAAGGQLSLTAACMILWGVLPPTGRRQAAVLLPIISGVGVLTVLQRRRARELPTDTRQATPA